MSDVMTNVARSRWLGPVVAVTVAAVLVTAELLDEPDLTLGQAMVESLEPVLMVGIAAAVAYLFGRVNCQDNERRALNGGRR